MNTSHPQPIEAKELERLRKRLAELEGADARHRSTEAALRESEQLYRRLVETSPDSIVLADVNGQILMANQQAAVLHGYPDPAELVGLNVMDIVPEDAQADANADIRQIVETGALRDRQHALMRKDGTSFIAEVTGSLVRDAAGEPKYIIYNGRDITARLRMQRELVESQKLESIGRLAGGIAHDFNNLLAVILGNASLQLRNRSLPAKTIESLKDVVEAAERASSLTTQLLAYARGGLRRAVPSELNKVVQDACEIMRPTLPRQVEFDIQLGANLPAVMIDRAQIQQVVINLAMNAIQATPAPGVVHVRTAAESCDEHRARELHIQPGDCAVLQIEDHGSGIDGATMERVFEPFFTTRTECRGMGLAASLGIVRSHKGRLRITSQPGRGTLATVWLPAMISGESTAVQPSPSPAIVNAPHGTETILVVEPDPAVCHTAEQILASLGYCVVTRNDLEPALAFLANNREDIDLVVLNISMPTRSGPGLVELMVERCPSTPLLLISGCDQNVDTDALLKLGASGFVQKPFSFMSLAQTVRRVLDSQASEANDH